MVSLLLWRRGKEGGIGVIDAMPLLPLLRRRRSVEVDSRSSICTHILSAMIYGHE